MTNHSWRGRRTGFGVLVAALVSAGGAAGAIVLTAQNAGQARLNGALLAVVVGLAARIVWLERRRAQVDASRQTLHAARERAGVYARVVESLAQVPDVVGRANRMLAVVADFVGAPVGVVYLQTDDRDDAITLVARRGLAHAPTDASAAGDLAERAMTERRVVVAAHPAAVLQFESLGARVAVRHEAHIPLLAGREREVLLGVLSVARTEDRPFDDTDLELLEHVTTSASLALHNALVSAQRDREAAVMRAVLASVTESIVVVATNGDIMLTNPPMDAYARRLTRIGPDEDWTPAMLREAMRREVRDPDAHDERMRVMAANPETIDRQIIELPHLGLWVHRYAAPIHGPSGALLGRIVVVRDITEERKAERAKDDLMATVSHELRTPLAAILGFAELLLTRDFPEDERREYLGTLHEQSLRLSQLLDEFLDLQRIERRGLDTLAILDVRSIIEDQVRLYSAQSAAHQLTTVVGDAPLDVRGDADRLRRMLGNLLSNAIKYSPGGGPVRVHAARDGAVVRLDVIDEGVGIAQDQQGRVFDRFVRVNSAASARIGGTGLGLSLVRDIVLAHGGEVGVDSVEGNGSRFWVTLPAAEQ